MLVLALLCTFTSFAQERIEKSYTLYFRINRSDIDTTYMDNGRTVAVMFDDISTALETDGIAPDSLSIDAFSSPEGPVALNNRLAGERAESARRLLAGKFPQFESSKTLVGSGINDWNGLLNRISRDSTIVHKDVLSEILTNPDIKDKTAALRAQREAYAELRDRVFGDMRTATVTFSFLVEPVDEPELPVRDTIPALTPVEPEVHFETEVPMKEPVEEPVEEDQPEVLPPFYMSVKSNMLYDLAAVPNVGLEFYLGKNFSVSGNWMYAWWKSDRIAWYWRTYGGDLAVRWWFGKAAKGKPLTGHHVGLYGQIITYDFQTGGRGYLGDRWSYGGGIEYGYSLPIGRRLNIDFVLGFGYLGGEYKEYLPIDGHHVWQATKYRHLIGPTKAEISLVWLLGRGNVNDRKGGRR